MADRLKLCPECRSQTSDAFRPFCSKRCADLDLSRWLTGGYAIPVADTPGEEGDDDHASSRPEGQSH